MNCAKGKIVFIYEIDTWVAQGNKSPITDYATGAFPNSPMNIEDFDFINIFFGEE